MTRCTVAIYAAALFVLVAPASIADAGGTTASGTNPGGKSINRGGAMFGANPGRKYVYSGSGAKFRTNPGGKYRWYGNSS